MNASPNQPVAGLRDRLFAAGTFFFVGAFGLFVLGLIALALGGLTLDRCRRTAGP